MSIEKHLAITLLAYCSVASVHAASCELEGVRAENVGQQAYEESRNNLELVDQQGLFDTWVILTKAILTGMTKVQDKEFVGMVNMSLRTMTEEKESIRKTIAQEAYPKLLGRVTLRTCKFAEEKGWRQ